MSAHLDRHAPGNLAHRRQQRQPTPIVGNRLIGDRDRARAHQPFGLRWVSSKVQIGENQLVLAQRTDLLGQRLLDLDDQLGDGEHIRGPRQDPRARSLVGSIVEADRCAGAALDDDLMSVMNELAHAARH